MKRGWVNYISSVACNALLIFVFLPLCITSRLSWGSAYSDAASVLKRCYHYYSCHQLCFQRVKTEYLGTFTDWYEIDLITVMYIHSSSKASFIFARSWKLVWLETNMSSRCMFFDSCSWTWNKYIVKSSQDIQ